MNTIIKATPDLYQKHKDTMIKLYLEAFYTNKSSEILTNKINIYFDRIFECGFGIFSLDKQKLTGAMLITPPEFDNIMPPEITENINPKKSLYIAELFIDKNYRGKGYGKQIMNYFFETVDKKYQTFIIRVLTNNKPAIKLYENFFFKQKNLILQKKIDENNNKIILEKIYLVKTKTKKVQPKN